MYIFTDEYFVKRKQTKYEKATIFEVMAISSCLSGSWATLVFTWCHVHTFLSSCLYLYSLT